MSALLDAALAYAKTGLRVFPCNWPVVRVSGVTCSCDSWRETQFDQKTGKPRGPCDRVGKHPKTYNGFYDATTDPERIREWWTRWPAANIGMPGGPENDLFILDVDPEHGGDASLAALEERHGVLPLTRRAITGSGGAHVLFRHIPGLSNSVGALGGGLDTRTAGGYIVVAPSLHRSGRRYAWANDAPIAAAPDWLVKLVMGEGADATPGGGQSGYWSRIAGGIREGERHWMIVKLSGLLLAPHARIEPILALALVRSFNAHCCNPPLPETDVDERFARVMKRQVRNER